MSNQSMFECRFCGKEFGKNVIDLAIHIGRIHDKSRNNTKSQNQEIEK